MGSTVRKRGSGYRSLFWPIVLISVGLIWLLGNLGILQTSNLVMLLRLWPVLLIAIGLDLLLGRSSPVVGAAIGLGTVALVIALMFVGPSLGLAPNMESNTTTISEPLGDARSADVTLNLSVGEVTISALENSTNLIAGDITYIGELDFRTEGGQDRQVYVGVKENGASFNLNLSPFDSIFSVTDAQLRWDVGLSPQIPLNLNIDGGVGDAALLLGELQLTGLDIDAGVGNMTVALPAGEYRASLDGGVGEFSLTIAAGADMTLTANGGVGGMTIDVPDDAAVRVEANGGLGDISVPRSFTQVSRGDSDPKIWETEGFGQADEQITILYNGGIGGLTIR